MIKYVESMSSVVMEEIPDCLSLALAISNCRGTCAECHSAFLRQDIGLELTEEVLDRLIRDNFGINCLLFLGEGNDIDTLLSLSHYIKQHYSLLIALYSGRNEVEQSLYNVFDYIKLGAYNSKYGPLNKQTTNQRLYKIHHMQGSCYREDITYRFWK